MIMGKTAELLARSSASRAASRTSSPCARTSAHAPPSRRASSKTRSSPSTPAEQFEPVTADVGPRANQTIEALAKLKPIFDRRDGTVTVGNSCQVTDGAAAVLVADAGTRHAPRASDVLGYVRAYAYAGLDPARMGLGPVFAIDQLFAKTGLSVSDVALFEINEAFAAQVLACLKAMASREFAANTSTATTRVGEIDPERLNVNGGAIALGHPGRRDRHADRADPAARDAPARRRLGIAALCVGGGQGAAILLESEVTCDEPARSSDTTIDDAVVTTVWMDAPGKPVNTCSPQLLAELDAVVAAIERDKPAGVIFASAKPKSFNAGADLFEIRKMSRPGYGELPRTGPGAVQPHRAAADADGRRDQRRLPGRRVRAGAGVQVPRRRGRDDHIDRPAGSEARPHPRLGRHDPPAAADRPDPRAADPARRQDDAAAQGAEGRAC